MRGAVIHGPRDVRFDERPAPTIVDPTEQYRAMDERRAFEALLRP